MMVLVAMVPHGSCIPACRTEISAGQLTSADGPEETVEPLGGEDQSMVVGCAEGGFVVADLDPAALAGDLDAVPVGLAGTRLVEVVLGERRDTGHSAAPSSGAGVGGDHYLKCDAGRRLYGLRTASRLVPGGAAVGHRGGPPRVGRRQRGWCSADAVGAGGCRRPMLSTSTAAAEPPDLSLIVRVVGQHTTLRLMGGGRLRGVCPFAGSSAFRVRPGQGTFYCFGCGAGGDARMLTSQIERDH